MSGQQYQKNVPVSLGLFYAIGEPVHKRKYVDKSIFYNLMPNNDLFTEFSNINKNIFDTNIKNINRLLVNYLSYHINTPDEYIFNFFDNHTKCIRTTIDTMISNGNFTVHEFIDMYNKYMKNLTVMIQMWRDIDFKISVNGMYDYSYIKLLGSCIFYANVLTATYQNGIGLEDVVTSTIDISNTDQMSGLFEIDNFCNKIIILDGFFKPVRFIQSKLPSETCDVIMNKIINDLNKLITTGENLINIKSLIRLGLTLNDNITFVTLYRNKLSQRLLTQKYKDLSFEKEILHAFNAKNVAEVLAMMCYQISDINSSIIDNNTLKRIVVNNVTTPINKNVVKFKILRDYAWDYDSTNTIENIRFPQRIQCYFDLIVQQYKNIYPYKKISYLYDKCVATITVNIHMKDQDCECKLQLNLLQLAVFMIINEYENISAVDIAKTLGVSLKAPFIAATLTALITNNLITLPVNCQNNPTVPFRINKEYLLENNRVSLLESQSDVQLPETSVDMQTDAQNNMLGTMQDETQENTPSAIVMKPMMLSYIVDKGTIDITELYEHMVNKYTYINEDIMIQMLQELQVQNKIFIDQNQVTYLNSN